MRLAAIFILIAALSCTAAYGQLGAPTLKWQKAGCTSWCQTGWYASPAVADIDGDGAQEIVWSAYSIWAVDGATGAVEWKVASGHDLSEPGASDVGRTWPGIVVADVDGNGDLEIVTAHGGGWLSVYNHDGYFYPGWPKQPTPGNELRSLAVDDLDRNGDLEIIAASTRSDNQWFVYEHTGVVRSGWPQHYPDSSTNGYAAGCFNENVGSADIDGDGRSEIIGPSDVHYVAAFNDDGSQILANAVHFGSGKFWSRVGVHVDDAVDVRGWANCGVEHRPNFADSAPTIADLNGDGVLEIIIVGNVYNCGTDPYTSLYQMPFVFKADRTRWAAGGYDWTVIPTPGPGSAPLSEDYNVIETAQPNPVTADLDGDGMLEILFASYDGKLHAYWLDKTEHHSWPYSVTKPPEGFIRFASEPSVIDMTGDGKAEIIFGSWPEKGNNRVGRLHILDYRGTPLYEVDLPAPTSGNWNGILGAPTVADIDGDGQLEVVVGTSGSGLVAYDLPGTPIARVLWGTGRGSYRRNGLAPSSGGSPTLTPIANAGPDQTVAYGTLVHLDGTSSISRRGTALTYAWSQTGGVAVTLSDSTAAQPTFTAPSTTTTLALSLIVNDGVESSAPDSVNVTVNASGQISEIRGKVKDKRRKAVAGARVTLKGGSVSMHTSSSASGDYSFKNIPAGKYTLKANKKRVGRAQKSITFKGGTLNVDLALR
ncbi:MAG: FG-GAP-like repeat-containing protein [Acidobacteriota bacterium]